MFSSFFEISLRSIGASLITDIFIVSILLFFLISLYWKKKGNHASFTNYTPTLLTSLGILGTFTGIISGLLDFNTSDIDTSIGPLLEGLKTAFITSLVGMLLSIVFKMLVSSGYFSDLDSIDEDDIDAADLYKILNLQVDSIQQLKRAVSDNDESSLVGQLKIFRSDFTENSKDSLSEIRSLNKLVSSILSEASASREKFDQFERALWEKLERFAEMLSKSATEQVIAALQKVIQDFNQNLTEQFGDNFRKLNDAVLELVVWQENYRSQLADMKLQYDNSVKAITKTEESVTHISEETKSIPSTMQSLKAVMETNQHQISELDRHLVAFQDVRDKAVEAVPEIKAQIEQAISGAKEANDRLASGIVESSDHIKSVISESADNYRDTVDRTRAALTDSAETTANSSENIKVQFADVITEINSTMRVLVSDLQEDSKSLSKSYKEASKSLITEMSSVSQAFSKNISEMENRLIKTFEEQAKLNREKAEQVFTGLEKSIDMTLGQTGESVQKQVNMLDKAMGQEIEKVMQSMGNALASISGTFTEDYSKLVKRMNDVTRQSVQ